MFFYDYHIHTNFSSDSDIPMEKMIEKAISLNLKEIAVTDHIDFNYPDTNFPFLFDDYAYTEKINYLKKKYAEKINILKGVEIGLQSHLKKEISNLCHNNFYDFIIGSTHCIEKKELHGNFFYEGKTKNEAYRIYFEDLYNNVKLYDEFSVYGHIDYVNRYGGYSDNSLFYNDYKDIIDEILKLIIKKDKGIEINTSGYKYGLNQAHPQLSILKRYKNLGGEIITIGSDAHSPEYISSHFEDAYNMLKEAGFTSFTRFKNKKAYFESIKNFKI